MTEETRLILDEIGKLDKKVDEGLGNLNARLDKEVGRLDEKIGRMDEKIGRLDEKIGSMDDKIAQSDEKFGKMDDKIGRMDEKIGSMDDKIAQLDEKMDRGFGEVNSQMAVMQDELQMVKLRIENEISPNIMRVAEGHLDLSRNLHDAMTPSKEVEMLSIRVGMLESEVRAIKQKIS